MHYRTKISLLHFLLKYNYKEGYDNEVQCGDYGFHDNCNEVSPYLVILMGLQSNYQDELNTAVEQCKEVL